MLGVAATAVLLCALPSVAAAQSPEVNTFADDLTPAGCTAAHCTLRERVAEETGSDPIQLQAGTYELTLGPLILDSFMQIEGVGARETTIDGNLLSRIGHVTTSAGVTFSQLTVTGGNANTEENLDQGHGGAFRVGFDADLILIDTTLTGNVALEHRWGDL